ncbi:MAG: MAPEG family protein [Pseudomonadota bacterium]
MLDPLPFEITALGWAALLAALQLVALSVVANLKVSQTYLAGPRDDPMQAPPVVGRLQRAQTNMFEALTLFAPAALYVALSGSSSGFTALCATLFLLARIGYVPLYAFGVPLWRSVVWMVGFLATVLMLLAALLL